MPLLPRRLCAAFVLLAALPLCAAEPVPAEYAPPKPDQVRSLELFPKEIKLRGTDAAAQVVVTATLADGRLQDLTGDCQYAVADPKLARASSSGRVQATADGSTKLVASFGGKTCGAAIVGTDTQANLPINFGNQVVPIFTKLGCNSGGCHGKASGQNGFKISLLGYEPEVDYQALVKEGRGRRLMPSAPDNSLFLLKATGAVAHGGGKKMEANSDEYKVVRRWIAAGLPFGSPSDPTVTKISVYPEHRILTRHNRQQFAVYAHYSDGHVEDITRRAQYDSNDQEIAMVDVGGVVSTLNLSGEAAIMARYQGHVATFRATVPLGLPTPAWDFAPKTVVDTFTSKKWKELGLVPSPASGDEQFLRRASLDLCGTLPTPAQVLAFVDDKDPNKRDKLIDRLVDSPEYSFVFAAKWADILRVKRGEGGNGEEKIVRAMGTFAFHDWIRQAMANDKPYNEFVTDILTATGDEGRNPAVVWYKDLKDPEQYVDDTAQVFLGLRVGCANCHHHPYEKWSQDDYWSFAAFFGRLGRKDVKTPSYNNIQMTLQTVFVKAGGTVQNKRTSKTAEIKPLDGEVLDIASNEDPREKLADWMTDPKNPFFAKAVANRYWAHFFGRGIVDPIDDMRVTNPPSNPELLDALAKTLIDNKYSLKALVKAIAKSRTYGLTSVPNEFNKHDKQNYARYYPKRLAAETLLDAVCQVTDSPTNFNNLPRDKFAPNRALELPDESFSSYFLEVFGRPKRNSSCECERVNEANLAQALHLLNSDEIQGKIGRGNGRIDVMASAKDTRTDSAKVEELFLWAFGRKPTSDDLKAALEHIETHAKAKKVAYENIVWALMNAKEFMFNQ